MSLHESLLFMPLVYGPKETYPELVPRIIHVYCTQPLKTSFIEGIVSHAPHFSLQSYDHHKAEQFLEYYFEPVVVERFRNLKDRVLAKELLWSGLLYIHGGKCLDEDSVMDRDPDLVGLEYQDRPRRSSWLRQMHSMTS